MNCYDILYIVLFATLMLLPCQLSDLGVYVYEKMLSSVYVYLVNILNR